MSLSVPISEGSAKGHAAALRAASSAPAASSRPTKLPRPLDRPARFPLSFAQERLWVLQQLDPNSAAYNIPRALRLKGVLNLEALQRTLDAMVQRHESLRTTFGTEAGEPVQIVAPAHPVRIRRVDLKSLPAQEREAEALREATQEAGKPFDLVQGPVLRVVLFELGIEDHLLFFNVHHIAYDGWSDNIFMRELATFYRTFLEAKTATVAELPIQCADFAVWQRERFRGDVLEKQLEYWKRQLAGAPTVLELPADRARPARQSFHGASRSFLISGKTVAALKQLSRQHASTIFVTLMAAFESLLHRYTGQADILIGYPAAGRDQFDTEDLIGFFINTLVLRADFTDDPTFEELLKRTRTAAFDAYDNQDLPFDRLVAELQPVRSLSHALLVQALFILHNQFVGECQFPGLTVSYPPVETGMVQFDLIMHLVPEAGALCGKLEYNKDLFETPTIDRLLRHFQTLLASIMANPRQRISELPLLTPAERQLLLVDWNQTVTDYPRRACVHELFEAQVERTPEAVAVVFEGQSLTYRELNRRANQLAHHLRGLGVGPEALVGLCVERSMEMVVGLIGILKAGGAYVPLDPRYPPERLAFMLEDAGTSVLVTQERLVPRLPAFQGHCVCLDFAGPAFEGPDAFAEANPAGQTVPENFAYVIYTSGSTGKPKGVALPHRALVNLIHWQVRNSTLGPGDKTLQFASLSFDVSFQEIFSTLCSGGVLVLIDEESRLDPALLWKVLAKHAVARLFLPFVALQQLAERADDATPAVPSLREVITAGEQLQITPKIAALFERLKDCTLCNQYGPSESHVVTSFALTGRASQWPTLPPIGRPIANTELFLLDRHLQPVPVGVPGELHIGGVALARYYWHRPELTEQKFIPHPFRSEPGARLYKTGDLARYRPDGNIDFLGRTDHQVKLRGFRVELGEIEAVLRQHVTVGECAVVVRETAQGNKRLIAYVVARDSTASVDVTAAGPPNMVADLRDWLKGKLPDYMLPAAWVQLKQLPVTPSGKVDHRALPEPEQGDAGTGVAFVNPRTPLEAALAAIWSQELEISQIGVHDDFFDLGGHSLLAVRVAVQLEQRFGKKLPVATLFAAPTVEQLAKAILDAENVPVQPRLCTLRSGHTKPPFFFLGELAFLRLLRLPAGQAFHVLRTRGITDSPAFTSLGQLAEDHLAVIKSVQPKGPYLLGGYCFDGVVAFEMAVQLMAQGHEVLLVAAVDTYPGDKGMVRLARRLVERLGPALGWDTAQTVRRAWPWINRITRFQNWTHLPAEKRAQETRNFLRRKDSEWKLRRVPGASSGTAPQPTATEPSDYMDARVIELGGVLPNELLYKRGWVVPRFAGKAAVFMCEENDTLRKDLRRHWLRLVPQVQIEVVPGNHQTCLTDHSAILAARVQVQIERALPGS